LRALDVTDGCSTFDLAVFAQCLSLVTLMVAGETVSIDDRAFVDCYSLWSVTISASIGVAAFSNCTALESLVATSVCATISERTFCGWGALRDITLSTGCSVADGAFTVASMVFHSWMWSSL
jgi:hypothetical protein